MGVTLNKDGTPRKIGSGKTKGAGCYEKITLRELRKLVQEDGEVSVSRVWLREAQEERKAKSINFALDVPKAKPEYSMPTTRPIEKKKIPQVTIDHNDEKDTIDIEDDEYEPPPLFASDAGVTNY